MTGTQQVRYSSNVEIAQELLDLAGKQAADVGCGEGRFTRFLARSGAATTGVDINQLALDRAAATAVEEGVTVTWRHARAETMPFADGELDLVVFSNSLHHVALERMEAALTEAARVLKAGGILYVMEPVAAGPYFDATRNVNDETVVRAKALEQIRRADQYGFSPESEIAYRTERRFDSYEQYREEQRRRSPKRGEILDALGETAQESFVSAARERDGALILDQFFRVNLLRRLG